MQSFQNFMQMDFVEFEELLPRVGVNFTASINFRSNSRLEGVVNLYSYNVIGCRHENIGRFTSVKL